MATAQPPPAAPVADRANVARAQPAGALAAAQALIPAETASEPKVLFAPASPLARLPVELEVAIPVRRFRVRNLLAIEPGAVIETQWSQGEDMPLAAGAVQLAWSEFEVLDTELAVRVTRLA
jgi:flagellar motor switch/type III secretory pathway protein FliN